MRTVVCISVAFLVLASCAFSAPRNLADFQAAYAAEQEKIDAVHAQALADLVGRYGKSLEIIKDRYKTDGDLQGSIRIKQEIERFEKEKTVPEDDAANFPDLMLKARSWYRASAAEAKTRKDTKTAGLTRTYIDALEGLKKDLVRQEKLEDAVKVQEEVQKAQFILAEIAPMPALPTAPSGNQATAAASPLATLPNGLVLYYSFDRTEEERIADESGNNNDGLIEGATREEDPIRKGAMAFDGDNGHVSIWSGPEANSNINTSEGAISAWVRAENNGFVYQYYSGHEDRLYLMKAKSRRFVFALGSSSVMTDEPVSAGWRHVVGTWRKDGKLLLYVDGAEAGAGKHKNPGFEFAGDERFYLGRGWRGNRNPFRGSIDDLMIFNRALSGQDVTRLFNRR